MSEREAKAEDIDDKELLVTLVQDGVVPVTTASQPQPSGTVGPDGGTSTAKGGENSNPVVVVGATAGKEDLAVGVSVAKAAKEDVAAAAGINIGKEDLDLAVGVIIPTEDSRTAEEGESPDTDTMSRDPERTAGATTGTGTGTSTGTSGAPQPSTRSSVEPGAYYGHGAETQLVARVDFSAVGLGLDESVNILSQGATDVQVNINGARSTAGTTGLAVANPVQDEEQGAAHEVDLERIAREKEQRRRKDFMTLAAAAFVILLGIVLLVVFLVLVPTADDEDKDIDPSPTTSMEDQNNATQTLNRIVIDPVLAEILPDYTIASIQQDAFSSQSKAYDWLLGDPNLQNLTDTRKIQRYALATLFYATGGVLGNVSQAVGWDDAPKWLDYDIHECDWDFTWIAPWLNIDLQYNVDLQGPCWETDQHQAPGEIYRHLGLVNRRLDGTLPEEMYLLTNLLSVVIDTNPLYGTVSTRIGQLANNLQFLSMSQNGLSGTIPSEIGKLTNLKVEYFWANTITGTIPTEQALLTKLEFFGLFLTLLTGPIPENLGPPNVKNFYLSNNQLSGTITSTLVSLTNLERLAIRLNSLSGTIPTEIGLMTSMWQIALDNNAFSGTIPEELGPLVADGELFLVNISANNFSGTVPFGLCALELPETLYQNHTQPPNAILLDDPYVEYDCDDQLCGCSCSCTRR